MRKGHPTMFQEVRFLVDIRKLRLSNITSPEFSHILLALYWPAYGIAFGLLETLRPLEACHPVWCALDDMIPFHELFLVPYLFWFVFLVGMNLYLGLFEPGEFRRFMYFIMFTYSVTLVIYLIYPTCQNLRPESFERDNFLTRFMAGFYAFDTNTNVCPSIHVCGSLAVSFAACHTRLFRHPVWKIAFLAMGLLISASTVFVKQHSVIDVFAAFILSAIGYVAVYILPKQMKTRRANVPGC